MWLAHAQDTLDRSEGMDYNEKFLQALLPVFGFIVVFN